MSNAAQRALRRLGRPEPVPATRALSVAIGIAIDQAGGSAILNAQGLGQPGRVVENLPTHLRDALEDLRSDDISDLRDDYVRARLKRRKI